MTPICDCKKPDPVRTNHPATQHYGAYTTVGCAKCGYPYDERHGSTSAPIRERHPSPGSTP